MKRVLVVLLALTGCSHLHEVEKAKVIPDWATFEKDQALREQAFAKAVGKLSLEFESDSESLRGLGSFAAVFPEKYLLELRDPVGRLHFQATSSAEKFEGYFPREKRLYRDRNSGKTFLSKVWGIPVSLKDLSRLSLGLLPAGIVPKAGQNFVIKEGRYVLPVTWNGKDAELELAANDYVFSQLKTRLDGQETVLTWRDFRPCCKWLSNSDGAEFRLAHVVDIKTSKVQMALDWKNVSPWDKVDANVFSLKKDASTKEIKLD